ncbi:MAG: putative holin-like toxin [Enterocloster sp.]
MSTYEELQLIVSVAMLIIAILNYTHKKIAVLTLQKSTAIF